MAQMTPLSCAGVMHYFDGIPGRCQCGEHWWMDGKTIPIYWAHDGEKIPIAAADPEPAPEPPRLRLVTDDG